MATQKEGAGPAARIAVDAEELIAALQSHDWEFRYFLDRSNGEIRFLGDEDVVEEDAELRSLIEEDEDRFVIIDPTPSSVGWQIMADFIEQLHAGKVRDRLTRAVQHGKPFRRFKDELLNYPDVREDWFAFEYRKMLEIAKDWLEDEGVEADLKTRETGSRSE